MSLLRSKLTYANVAATLALVLSLSGTSYALIVGSKQIKNESITAVDIKDDSVTSAELSVASVGTREVIDGSLKLRDLNSEVKNSFDPRGFLHRPVLGSGNGVVIPPEPSAENVALFTLPRGPYTVVASLQIQGGLGNPNSPGDYEVACRLSDVGTGVATTRSVDLRWEYHHNVEMTLTLTHGFSGEGVLIDCNRGRFASMSSDPRVMEAEVVAIPLKSITTK